MTWRLGAARTKKTFDDIFSHLGASKCDAMRDKQTDETPSDGNKNSSVAVGPGNGEMHISCPFVRCYGDAARKARCYCACYKSTAVAAGTVPTLEMLVL